MRRIIVSTAGVILIAGAVLSVFWANHINSHRDGPSPWAPFHMLTAAIRMYELDQGKLPDSLSDLVEPDGSKTWVGPYVGGKFPRDAWGKQIQYRVLGVKDFELRSVGPDGVEGTSDDMVKGTQQENP